MKYVRKQRGLSQADLADQLMIGRSKIAHYESGKQINPPLEELVRISNYFNTTIDDLLKKDLSKKEDDKSKIEDASVITGEVLRILAISVDAKGQENVELVPIKARAGYQAGYKDPEFIGALPKFAIPNLSKNKTYRIFPTYGDSMYPYPENCMVVGEYVTDWSLLKDVPCVVILKSQQDFLFKMVKYEDNQFVLRSLNTMYPDQKVKPSDILEIWRYQSHLSEEMPSPSSPIENIVLIVNEIKRDVAFLRHHNK